MSDLLVKLYVIDYAFNESLAEDGIFLKRASIINKKAILDFVKESFPGSPTWGNECECALMSCPSTCWIAVKDMQVIGFACFDATAKGFFGPTGVREDMRGKGIGKELLLRALYSLKESGYAYAIIGWSSEESLVFYKKTVQAIEIEDSPPGKSIYHNCIWMK